MLAESEGETPDYNLPCIEEADYLVGMIAEIGEAKSHGQSLVQIEWQDILSWIEVTGAQISPGEAEAMKSLSGAYVSQYYQSLDSGSVSPVAPRQANREAVASKMHSLFAMLRGNTDG